PAVFIVTPSAQQRIPVGSSWITKVAFSGKPTPTISWRFSPALSEAVTAFTEDNSGSTRQLFSTSAKPNLRASEIVARETDEETGSFWKQTSGDLEKTEFFFSPEQKGELDEQNDEAIEEERFQFSDDGGLMVNLNVHPEDAGIYTVMVENPLGQDSFDINLEVTSSR
ncbi:unnamed protein product, partial [Protopolystoma xenopodis]